MSTAYVQDNVPDDDGKFWWHHVTGISFTETAGDRGLTQQADIFLTGCGDKVTGSPAVIHDDMTIARWAERFGENLDLCLCAVTDKDDMQKLMGIVEGSASATPAE